MFTFIIGITAFIVAGCAAYFSVQGLASLYAGSYLAVCIMAGSLEIGKLVAASYLKRYWKETTFLLKLYLLSSVLLLMGITSLGIFGFLTSAYQKSHAQVEIIDTQRQALESKKNSFTSQIDGFNNRIKTLNDIRILQEQRVQESGNYKNPREQAYEAIKNANEEIETSQNKIKEIQTELQSINLQLIDLKLEETKSSDIGTLRFLSNIFNVSTEKIVKWFTFIIVLVFDPLAVCLILAYNTLVKKSKDTILPEEVLNVEDKPEKFFRKIFKPINVKYQDK